MKDNDLKVVVRHRGDHPPVVYVSRRLWTPQLVRDFLCDQGVLSSSVVDYNDEIEPRCYAEPDTDDDDAPPPSKRRPSSSTYHLHARVCVWLYWKESQSVLFCLCGGGSLTRPTQVAPNAKPRKRSNGACRARHLRRACCAARRSGGATPASVCAPRCVCVV